ncbi:thiamine phosphate synthase [Clostridium sp.]|uniref:thiamine phosphate synthase n=1 Tax=Clostridium sp. TaxID=1506 RepID=UPI0032179C3B
MNICKEDMKLYVVTDRTWLKDKTLAEEVEKILECGATFLQLREKKLSYEEVILEAREIKKITDKYKVPFVINDDIKVAIEVNADGIHIGQGDMDAKEARMLIGQDKILGVTAKTVAQAIKAEADGADYLGVGAAFSTSTKLDTNVISFDTIRDICNGVSVPVVAIGGISEKNILKLKGVGVDGVAVVSAIFAKEDVGSATKEMLKLSEDMLILSNEI